MSQKSFVTYCVLVYELLNCTVNCLHYIALVIIKLISMRHQWKNTDKGKKGIPGETLSLGGFGDLDVACWPLVPKLTGSNPAEAVGFFRAKKILSTPSFGREVKPFVPRSIFAVCKRTRKCMRGSRSFLSKLPAISRPSSSSFHC